MHLQKFCETDFLVSPIESKPYLSKRSEPGKRFKIFEKTMTSVIWITGSAISQHMAHGECFLLRVLRSLLHLQAL